MLLFFLLMFVIPAKVSGVLWWIVGLQTIFNWSYLPLTKKSSESPLRSQENTKVTIYYHCPPFIKTLQGEKVLEKQTDLPLALYNFYLDFVVSSLLLLAVHPRIWPFLGFILSFVYVFCQVLLRTPLSQLLYLAYLFSILLILLHAWVLLLNLYIFTGIIKFQVCRYWPERATTHGSAWAHLLSRKHFLQYK